MHLTTVNSLIFVTIYVLELGTSLRLFLKDACITCKIYFKISPKLRNLQLFPASLISELFPSEMFQEYRVCVVCVVSAKDIQCHV